MGGFEFSASGEPWRIVFRWTNAGPEGDHRLPYAVAAALHVPRSRIERIARKEKPVTADTALRLGKFFKTGAAFWMNIQARYDLEMAEDVLAPEIRKIAAYRAA